ncbi:MAG: DUF1153 domain-containing protein [Proteobacteria bacterium]|nr:DUF1153 domain-containing protein [Pseudomonadota bacterium]MDA0915120.1 DUF1153 domain-containing protein [Pseudomonadota bacterium]MDA1032025.1 DUF1153 domain-containing protein [Pseudomonadota bacterium]
MSDAITRAGLPENHDIHWSKARKEEVVQAVQEKLISFDEARWHYLLSHSEFRQWEQQVDARHTQKITPKQPLELRNRELAIGGELEEA